MKIEFRTSALKVQTVGDARIITGHAAVFDTPTVIEGAFREQFTRGAFVDAIASSDIACLWNHDSNLILGRTSAGTLRLSEDESGLLYECDPPDTQWGRDALVSIARGDVAGCSFRFEATEQDWTRGGEMPLRTVRGCRLLEVGPNVFPAYPSTNCQVRSAEDVMAEYRALSAPSLEDPLQAARAQVSAMAESLTAPASR